MRLDSKITAANKKSHLQFQLSLLILNKKVAANGLGRAQTAQPPIHPFLLYKKWNSQIIPFAFFLRNPHLCQQKLLPNIDFLMRVLFFFMCPSHHPFLRDVFVISPDFGWGVGAFLTQYINIKQNVILKNIQDGGATMLCSLTQWVY